MNEGKRREEKGRREGSEMMMLIREVFTNRGIKRNFSSQDVPLS